MIHVFFIVLENPKKTKLACLLLIKIGSIGIEVNEKRFLHKGGTLQNFKKKTNFYDQ